MVARARTCTDRWVHARSSNLGAQTLLIAGHSRNSNASDLVKKHTHVNHSAVANARKSPISICKEGCGALLRRNKMMNKLILFTAALLVVGQASAHARADSTNWHHRRLMSSHAQWRGHEGRAYYRVPEYAPPAIAPSYGDDPSAEGRTSG
jgi:hypothetical protein